MSILERLQQWQAEQARREGVEPYRVLPYRTLVELAHVQPKSKEALLEVKGIGAVKARRYGTALLVILHDAQNDTNRADVQKVQTVSLAQVAHNGETGELASCDGGDVFSVSAFLGALNVLMTSHFQRVRVRGEIVDFRRNHTGHAYFQIKDVHGIMRMTVFRGAYDLSGIDLADGLEVIVTGHPQHHAQYGFSFIGETIELAGEGALKKAYDMLKAKLVAEGFFALERKRPVPPFATRVGLITSRDGAAIGDFMTNLSRHGFAVHLVHSAVEGQHAVHALRRALQTLHTLAEQGGIDVVVITRGGGSLESLQAFNNEAIVRMIAAFPVPVIAGIGHERDETLATLVADVGVSTPTAAAKALAQPWEDALAHLAQRQRSIVMAYEDALMRVRRRSVSMPQLFVTYFQTVLDRFARAQQRFMHNVMRYEQSVGNAYTRIAQNIHTMQSAQHRGLRATRMRIASVERVLVARDPHTLLARGYAIVQSNGSVVRNARAVRPGDALNIRVSSGTIEAVVKE